MKRDETNATRLHRTVDVDGETVEYAINRRGCSGPWTERDDEMMARLVRATVRMQQQRKADA